MKTYMYADQVMVGAKRLKIAAVVLATGPLHAQKVLEARLKEVNQGDISTLLGSFVELDNRGINGAYILMETPCS